ncbi:MAG: hypothetical protein ACOYYS_18470 [Chloroflexota bacterium]
MELVTLSCPACGAPVRFAENALVVLCAYCRAQVGRAEETPPVDLAQGLQALRNLQYEQAALCFAEVLRRDPQDRQAWLGRAVATAFKPYGSAAEALGFFQEAHLTSEEAITWLAQLTTESSALFDACLKRSGDLARFAPSFAALVLEGALHSQNPAHRASVAQACTAAADRAWQGGDVAQATAYMRRALQLDPDQRPQNLWLLELAQKA